MSTDYPNYHVAKRFAHAILTGDRSELSETDHAQLDRFLALVKAHAQGNMGVWQCDEPDGRFQVCHITGRLGKCLPCRYML